MKVHHRPYSFEDGPVVYMAAALNLVREVIRCRLVQVRPNLKKKKQVDVSLSALAGCV